MIHDHRRIENIESFLNSCILEIDQYINNQPQDARANELALDLINLRNKISALKKDRAKVNEEGYGRCPACGGRGIQRERRPDGNDTCENGHVYPTATRIRK